MSAQKFNGRFLCHSSENFEEYLKECGFGYFLRKAAVNMSVTLDIRNQGKRWTITQESTFKTISQEFELDKEFEETTADGRKFMTLVTFTPNTVQVGSPVKTIRPGRPRPAPSGPMPFCGSYREKFDIISTAFILIQRQRKIKDTDKDCLITRYLEDDDTLVIVIEYGSVTAKRIFKRIRS
ncbi:hypothetical protein PRIPAC_87904 [Pristionchus pacificus]|uniref:Lipocln_cytosolic_FA-bd_dom domain-containing protein n=1 Tax=Pristionchus pacificus TaxID=54126 RepID=A0A2A6B9G6_PRIPA|nr:hypothetical protein PRIPAC_87904 [Pristionchus pacificus]|eukprot:PDM62532.1 hypothetical protein PRIPAC_51974 [Pristionchus pacificus]